jgi:hypothetical protein
VRDGIGGPRIMDELMDELMDEFRRSFLDVLSSADVQWIWAFSFWTFARKFVKNIN